MKINNIQINRFGKLQNYSLDFEDGFNIVYGNNEDGKSTIMAFIKMMFYGSTGKSQDLSKNMRKKYMPWDGAKMSGSIEFDDKGITYRIEKMFGASNSTDKISLWNKATGEKEKIASGTDLGQRFFGVGAVAFEKSVFIGQSGSVANSGADKEDEITQKLLNMVSTGDESVSQKKVENRLQTAKEELKSKSGRIGVLDKQYQELNNLAEARLVAQGEEENKKQMEQQRATLTEQKEILEETYQHDKSQYELQERLNQLQGLDKLVLKKQAIDKVIAECDDRKRQLTVGDITVDSEFVKSCEDQILQIQSLEEVCSERSRNAQALEEEDNDSKSQVVPEVPQEYVEKVKTKKKELASLQISISELKDYIHKVTEMAKKQADFTECEKQFSEQTEEKQRRESALIDTRAELKTARESVAERNEDLENRKKELNSAEQQQENTNTEYQVAVHNMKSVELLSNQKIEAANEQLKQSSTAKKVVVNKNVGHILNKPMLAAAVVIVILSIVLGITVHPACFGGAVIAAVLGIVAFGKTKTKAVTTTLVDEAASASAKANLESIQHLAEQDNETALEAKKSAYEKLQELKAKVEHLQKAVAEWERLYQTATERVSRAEQKKNELEINLKFINERLFGLTQEIQAKQLEMGGTNKQVGQVDVHSLQEQLSDKTAYETELKSRIHTQLLNMDCETIDELQNKSMQMQNYQTKAAMKSENLTKAKADGNMAKENSHRCVQKFIAFVSQYETAASYEDAVNALQNAKNAIDEINTFQVKINSNSEFLNEEMRGRTAEQIGREAAEIREQILEANDGIIPIKQDDFEIEQIKQRCQNNFVKLQEVREDLIKQSSNIKSQFIGKKNVSEIEEKMRQVKSEIEERKSHYECLDIAQSTLTEAFAEIRQSFGPLLNDKTAEIFNSLTGGKYNNVIISRNFDINVQDEQSAVSHEWQYLSKGTIDQVYLALRLAVTKLLSQGSEELPLMLDDVFLQYDDSRTKQGMKFLVDFANEGAVSTQIILFTCHNSTIEWAQKNLMNVSTKRIFQSAN